MKKTMFFAITIIAFLSSFTLLFSPPPGTGTTTIGTHTGTCTGSNLMIIPRPDKKILIINGKVDLYYQHLCPSAILDSVIIYKLDGNSSTKLTASQYQVTTEESLIKVTIFTNQKINVRVKLTFNGLITQNTYQVIYDSIKSKGNNNPIDKAAHKKSKGVSTPKQIPVVHRTTEPCQVKSFEEKYILDVPDDSVPTNIMSPRKN